MAEEREQKIRERAYKIWQDEGQPEGRDQAHWTQAEQEHGSGDEGGADLAHNEPADSDTLISDADTDLPFGEPADTGMADQALGDATPPQTTAAEPTDNGTASTRIASASGAVEPPATASATKKGSRGKARTKTAD